MRSAITKNQARARARERMGQRLAREAAFLEHAAAWELAHDAMNVALGRMYEAGFTRAEIAERLGIPTSRVVKPEEIAAAGGADSEESVVQGDESDEQAAGDDESRAVDVARCSGDDSGDH